MSTHDWLSVRTFVRGAGWLAAWLVLTAVITPRDSRAWPEASPNFLYADMSAVMVLPSDRVADICVDGQLQHEGVGYFIKRCELSLIDDDDNPENFSFPFNYFQFEVFLIGETAMDEGGYRYDGCFVNMARINNVSGYYSGLNLNHWDIANLCPLFIYNVLRHSYRDGLYWRYDGFMDGLQWGVLDDEGGATGLSGNVVISPRYNDEFQFSVVTLLSNLVVAGIVLLVLVLLWRAVKAVRGMIR